LKSYSPAHFFRKIFYQEPEEVKNWLDSDSQSIPPGALPSLFWQHFSVDSVQVDSDFEFAFIANASPEPASIVIIPNIKNFLFMSLGFYSV
jgi:hypothetical protein